MRDETMQIGTRALSALFLAAVDAGVERGRMDSEAEIASLNARITELATKVNSLKNDIEEHVQYQEEKAKRIVGLENRVYQLNAELDKSRAQSADDLQQKAQTAPPPITPGFFHACNVDDKAHYVASYDVPLPGTPDDQGV